MPVVRGAFIAKLGYYKDKCSRIRHLLARLGLCKHDTEWISLEQIQIEINELHKKRMEGYRGLF